MRPLFVPSVATGPFLSDKQHRLLQMTLGQNEKNDGQAHGECQAALKNPVAHFVNVVLCLQTHAEDEDDAVTTQDSTDELALCVCSLRALDSEANHSSFPISCILYFIDVPFVCAARVAGSCRKVLSIQHMLCACAGKLEWNGGGCIHCCAATTALASVSAMKRFAPPTTESIPAARSPVGFQTASHPPPNTLLL